MMQDLFGNIGEDKYIRKCKTCHNVKGIEEFYFRQSRGYYEGTCKKCRVEIYKDQRRKKQEENPKNNPIAVEEKLCTKCNFMKDASCFGRFRGAKDGLQAWCKDCINEYSARKWDSRRIKRPDYSTWIDGMTCKEFAESAGCSEASARVYAKKNNLSFRKERKFDPSRKEKFISYLNDGLTYNDVARLEGISTPGVYRFCKRIGIKLRTKTGG